jgi:hypothetical protein
LDHLPLTICHASNDSDPSRRSPGLTRQELVDDLLRMGLPRYPRWVKFVSLGVTGLAGGLSMLGEALMSDDKTYFVVGGTVLASIGLLSLPIGLRIRSSSNGRSTCRPGRTPMDGRRQPPKHR